MKTYTLLQAAKQMNKVCDGLGDLFLKRVDKNYDHKNNSLPISNHLLLSFEWSKSKEDHQFWDEIHTMFYEYEEGMAIKTKKK